MSWHLAGLSVNNMRTAGSAWVAAVRSKGEIGLQVWEAIERLAAEGCERPIIGYDCVRLGRARHSGAVSRKLWLKAVRDAKRSEHSFGPSREESARRATRARYNPENVVPHKNYLTHVRAHIESLEREAVNATARENVEFNDVMGEMVRYLRQVTGQFHDEDLSRIVPAIMGRTFSSMAWRKRHWEPLGIVAQDCRGPEHSSCGTYRSNASEHLDLFRDMKRTAS